MYKCLPSGTEIVVEELRFYKFIAELYYEINLFIFIKGLRKLAICQYSSAEKIFLSFKKRNLNFHYNFETKKKLRFYCCTISFTFCNFRCKFSIFYYTHNFFIVPENVPTILDIYATVSTAHKDV